MKNDPNKRIVQLNVGQLSGIECVTHLLEVRAAGFAVSDYCLLLTITQNVLRKYSRHSSYVKCNNISIRSLCSFDNLLFKFNVSLPLVTGKLLQNTVDVNNVTYKLYNIIQTVLYCVLYTVQTVCKLYIVCHIINIYRVLKKLPGN